MKKNHVNAILKDQTRRRNTIFGFICAIIVTTILSFSLFIAYSAKNKNVYVNYDESSDINYKVYLKDNEFFEDNYLGNDKQYIASLIDYISADFKYNLSFDSDDVEYKYEYRIDANVNVYDKETKKVLFNKTTNLVKPQEYTTKDKKVSIKKSVNIDYNEFNDLIQKFVGLYGLDDVDSVLTIDMYVNTIGSCEEFDKNEKNESVITLSIPLTTKTIAIELSDDLIDTENNLLLCKKNSTHYLILVMAILVLIIDCILIVYTIMYEIKTRTSETLYNKQLKKILNNYGSYIQEMGDDFDFKDCRLVKINTFEDMLEIRDTIKQPILMKENSEKKSAYFIIPSNEKFLYIYRINVSDFKDNTEF